MEHVNYIKTASSSQMAAIEGKAYEEGYAEETFMENAGKGISLYAKLFSLHHDFERRFILLCGKGNNGGDAHVAGRYLIDQGYEIIAYQVGPLEQCSPLCQKNFHRLEKKGAKIYLVSSAEEINLEHKGLLIDALFGTGLHSAPREPYASIIKKANASGLPILAVDIPSGLDGDTGTVPGAAIQADVTIFLGLPKRGFFLEEGWNHVGKLHGVDFGLPRRHVEEAEAELLMFEKTDFCKLIPRPVRNRHKYQAGYVVGVAGSPGMPGAAMLSGAGALRGGAGIVRLLHPKGMEAELSSSPYELIRTPYDESEGGFDNAIEQIRRASALFAGPGLSLHESARKALETLLSKATVPIVLDADALNILAANGIPYPKQSIITPHVGEMRRLLHSQEKGPVNGEFLKVCQNYVEEKKVTLILKGGPTFVLHPGEPAVVVPYGNPGMATAGSGDVLTGIAAAMAAQGLPPREAALSAVFAHAYAGDRAAEVKTPFSMTASDIIEYLPHAFKLLEKRVL